MDMGFQRDLDAILQLLPPPSARQTLLFSATIPDDVASMIRRALRPQYAIVDCVPKDEQPSHHKIQQSYVIAPFATHMEILYEIVNLQRRVHNYKIMCFFTTARVTQFMSIMFNKAGIPTLELHSRLSQSKRNSTSELFRASNNVVLFSSDVSARGLDYPNVTFVCQVGLTDKDQYVHRVGRTGRAGNEGEAMMLLCDFEKAFLQQLKDHPIEEFKCPTNSPLGQALQRTEPNPSHPLTAALSRVANDANLLQNAATAYSSWLGFYNSQLRLLRWTKEQLVAKANEYSTYLGCPEVPALEAKTVGKMGLRGVAGLRVESGRGGGRSGRNGQRGGGGSRPQSGQQQGSSGNK